MKTVSIVRIYIREGDRHAGHNLMQEIFRTLHDEHKVRGVTAFRGIAGFGSHGTILADDILRLSVHLPLVLEFYDDPEKVDAILPVLLDLVPPGHLLRWEADCNCI